MVSIFTQHKGQLSIQFNWVFVLIIGAVILGFFLTVINGQQKRASAEEATELAETLDTVFNAIATNPDTVEEFSISNAELEFMCEPGVAGLTEYYIQGAGPVPTDYDVIFSPSVLRGDKINTWTNTWYAPFETTIFMNLANDRTIFLFVASDRNSPILDLYNELPDIFKKYKFSKDEFEEFETKGYDRYVVITDISNLVPSEAIKENVRMRILNNNIDESGSITFVEESNTPKQYLSRPMLWGAIFTENAETYECTVRKALVRHNIVASVLQERVLNLKQELSATRCYDFYDEADEYLSNIISNPESTTLSNRKSAIDNLIKTQNTMMRGPLCPNIY